MATLPSSGALASSGALSALGVGPPSEQLYRVVLRNPGTTIAVLADRTGRTAAEVRRDLAALLETGLVTSTADVVRAQPPQTAFATLLARESRRLVAAEEALAQTRLDVFRYESEHQAGLTPGIQPLAAELVEPSATRAVLNALAISTTGEMLFLRPDNWRTPASGSTDAVVTEALNAGRASRAMYPTEFVEDPGPWHLQRLAAGERVRISPHVPCRMAVFGDEAAVLPQTWGAASVSAIVVRQPGVVSACRAWFDELWSHGVEVSDGHQRRDPDRAQLLDLLMRGVKDERVARTLGVSLRTVRRRIADLLAELGVTSRFQAGAEAVRRGWV